MTTTEVHVCEEDGCGNRAVTFGNENVSRWCEHHLRKRQREQREIDSPGLQTAWKTMQVRLRLVPTAPDMCCNGKAAKEGLVLRLSKWLGLSNFDYRAVPDDGLYTIRRSKRGWGRGRNVLFWELCQCGGWLPHDAFSGSQRREKALRTFASSATADRVAWRLQKGLPTFPDKLAIAAAALVIAATVVEATLEVVDLLD